ncbi:hypothetical protein TNCT_16301 [Trichonephila clavata]|uniref:Uncharacterized protein n=1 Tax=Trichonephila clavata TaxID=2740835 RepID=A0A8X6F400_TRICU|nr:hypothetical protein TNCT_539711 [Trichonephila clavata]GFQ97522.1 hypothetical protein TNCT_16301 [Trichonephila clavata]
MLKLEEAKGILQQNSRETCESRMLFKLKEGKGTPAFLKRFPLILENVCRNHSSLKFEGVSLSSLEIENNSTGRGDRKFDDLIPFCVSNDNQKQTKECM